MRNLVWLASYPKSGNTWLRALLTAYLDPAGGPLDINRMNIGTHSASRQLFDHAVGVPSAYLRDAEIEHCRAGVLRRFDAGIEQPQFVKVHDRWRHGKALADPGAGVAAASRAQADASIFPADSTLATVVIVRNPLAVAPSFAHHMGVSIDEAIGAMANPRFVLAGIGQSVSNQLAQPLGSWSTHTASWLEQDELPVTLVRYEDLSANTPGTLGRVLTAVGLTVDPARVDSAVAASGFDQLKAAEQESGFVEAVGAGRVFFRRGLVDGWRAELTADQIDRIRADHRDWMLRLGYQDQPVVAAL